MKQLQKLVFGVYESGILWTVFLVFGLQAVVSIRGLKWFPLENTGYLIIGFFIFFPILIMNHRYGVQIEAILKKKGSTPPCCFVGFSFFDPIIFVFWRLF